MTVQPAGTLHYVDPDSGMWTPLGIPPHTHPSVTRIPGEIIMWAGATVPVGWLACVGGGKSTTTYAALFAAIGYAWGGSGSSFNIPDLRGNVPVGAGGAMGALGAYGGENSHQHTTDAVTTSSAAHSHTVDVGSSTSSSAGGHSHGTGTPSSTTSAADGSVQPVAGSAHSHSTGSGGSHTHSTNPSSVSTSSVAHAHTTPGTTSHSGSTHQPYAVVNFIIFVG